MVRTCNLLMAFFAVSPNRLCKRQETRCTEILIAVLIHAVSNTSVPVQHLVAVACVGVAEALDVVEDQPGQGDDHQHDEGDGDEHHGGAADGFLQVACADGDVHGHGYVLLQQGHDLTTFGLRNHDRHHVAGT